LVRNVFPARICFCTFSNAKLYSSKDKGNFLKVKMSFSPWAMNEFPIVENHTVMFEVDPVSENNLMSFISKSITIGMYLCLSWIIHKVDCQIYRSLCLQ
jgi:hypothetical protein